MITFDKSVREFIFDTFDKTLDKEGFLVEKDNLNQKVLTPEGLEIKEDEFGGVKKGSEVYIKSDLPSIIKLSDSLKRSNEPTR